MKIPDVAKERNLVKAALRRVFSRSELRKNALEKNVLELFDPNRPRVTKWVFCDICGLIFPKYLAQVDHIVPLIELDKTLESYTWDQIIERLWCEVNNLSVLDKACHKAKSKEENKQRREFRKKVK